MPVFEVYVDQCMGFSHCGIISEDGCSEVELTDSEVETLVDLIRKNGTPDVEELKLSELFPDIYAKLDKACYEAACDAEETHWLEEGFYMPECRNFDDREMIEYLKEKNAFDFEYDKEEFLDEDGNLDEEALADAEVEFLHDEALESYMYSLDGKEKNDFLRDKVGIQVDLDYVNYTVSIPEEIVDMANKKEGN